MMFLFIFFQTGEFDVPAVHFRECTEPARHPLRGFMPRYWLVHQHPYNGSLQSSQHCVVSNPLYQHYLN